jgi:FtsH-binding integral membrane protein
MAERRPDQARGFLSFGVVIIIALVIGIFLKNVRLGLIIGLVLGLLGSSLLRRR